MMVSALSSPARRISPLRFGVLARVADEASSPPLVLSAHTTRVFPAYNFLASRASSMASWTSATVGLGELACSIRP